MKKLLFFGLYIFSSTIFAQIPTGYYDGTAGLTGSALKTKLSSIITNGHQDHGYDGLWTAYYTTDRDKYYEKDNTLLDMYSEKPASTDSYSFTLGSNQCGIGGSYNSEGDCYNREHTIPQSSFNDASPMRNDLQHVLPTDGYVNNRRGTLAYGTVSSATWTSTNGSKIGPSSVANYSGTVFEPIDEFKGDFARIILYFATRYETQLSGFDFPMLGKSKFPGIESWALPMLLQWNQNDPVSQKERDRNDAAYAYQGNRNPFIDHSNWVNDIWGTPIADTEAPSVPTNLTVTGSTSNTVSLTWTASTDNIGVSGYEVYVDNVLKTTLTTTSGTITGLSPSTTYSFSIKAKDGAGNVSGISNSVNGTTTANSGGGTTTTCGTENFENIPASSSSYTTRTWTNNGITWNATDARTDDTIDNRAIIIRNGTLESSSISGGIQSLTVTTQLKYSGSSGTFKLYVNGVEKGTIPYSTSVATTTITGINTTGDIVISLQNNSTTSNRVAFDNLSWTCYNPLSTNEVEKVKWTIYPNPVKNNILFINGKDLQKIKRVEIYTMNGNLVQVAEHPFIHKNSIPLRNLGKGIYILKAESATQKFIIE